MKQIFHRKINIMHGAEKVLSVKAFGPDGRIGNARTWAEIKQYLESEFDEYVRRHPEVENTRDFSSMVSGILSALDNYQDGMTVYDFSENELTSAKKGRVIIRRFMENDEMPIMLIKDDEAKKDTAIFITDIVKAVEQYVPPTIIDNEVVHYV